MLRRRSRPQTKAVMMLAGEDDAIHSRHSQRPHDRPGVERRRHEERLRLVAISPLFVGKRIHRKMEEGAEFTFLPCDLRRRWGRTEDEGRRNLTIGPSGRYGEEAENENARKEDALHGGDATISRPSSPSCFLPLHPMGGRRRPESRAEPLRRSR